MVEPETSERARRALAGLRENIVVLGLIAGLAYALGFITLYASVSRFGVGPISPTREAAIAIGFVSVVTVIPTLSAIWTYREAAGSGKVIWWTLPAVFLIGTLSILGIAMFMSLVVLREHTADYRVWVTLSASPTMFLAIAVFQELFNARFRSSKMILYIGAPLVILAHVGILSAHLPSIVKPEFGGHHLQAVYATFAGSKEPVRLILVTADDTNAVFLDPDVSPHPILRSQRDMQRYNRYIRVMWEKVEKLETFVKSPSQQ